MTGDVTWARGPAHFPGGRKPEECTSASHRLRHLSTNLHESRNVPQVPGRGGRTLCGSAAEDERRANYWIRKWSQGMPIVVADLKPCRRCYRPVREAG